jgi:hypothetical protein
VEEISHIGAQLHAEELLTSRQLDPAVLTGQAKIDLLFFSQLLQRCLHYWIMISPKVKSTASLQFFATSAKKSIALVIDTI